MSFLKSLFGGGKPLAPAPVPSETYNGYLIRATPYREGGQFQMCGEIEKAINGETRVHRFVRADRFAGEDEAVSFTFAKARQIIDLNGDRIF